MKSQTVTPFVSESEMAEKSRCGAFVSLAKLAVENNRLHEAEQLYRCAIGEAEEAYGADTKEVARLIDDLADLYSAQGKIALSLMYRRRARSIV
jgi:uncharacterized protein HemY